MCSKSFSSLLQVLLHLNYLTTIYLYYFVAKVAKDIVIIANFFSYKRVKKIEGRGNMSSFATRSVKCFPYRRLRCSKSFSGFATN